MTLIDNTYEFDENGPLIDLIIIYGIAQCDFGYFSPGSYRHTVAEKACNEIYKVIYNRLKIG